MKCNVSDKLYIDRTAAIMTAINYDGNGNAQDASQDIASALSALPAADVREVVTCEACVWHVDDGTHYCNKWCEPCPDNAEFFCAYGERDNCGADMRETEPQKCDTCSHGSHWDGVVICDRDGQRHDRDGGCDHDS